MEYIIERYSPEVREQWDAFIRGSKNGTFLFLRDYMDYHADRFRDYSLMARNEKGKIVAVLPANADGAILKSHAGLTFGGWIGCYKDFDVISLLEIQNQTNKILSDNGFKELHYKPVPYIYSRYPAQEDLYMLFRYNAIRAVSQVSMAVDLQSDAGPDTAMRRKARQAVKDGLEFGESDDLASFWTILSELLATRYNVQPVHTLEEILLLKNRFPENIRLFSVFRGGKILGGTVLYISGEVLHAQYIASGPEGKQLNALPLLFSSLIEKGRLEGYRWFDFGTCNEDGGLYLNQGLARQKISFGGRAVIYDTYIMQIPRKK